MNHIEISIHSPIFENFLTALDNAILDCVEEIHAENFSGGEIAAKINIEFENAVEFYPTGEHKEDAYHYKKPNIEHKVTMTLKKREESNGKYNEPLELIKENDRFILTEPKKAQTSLFEKGSGVQ